MTKQKLPVSVKITYSIGQLGWSTLVNLIGLQLVYFYIPPENAGIKSYIPQITFLVVLNIISILAAAGRLWDAVTDPLIANMSDRWKGKNGRRIPFLIAGSIPAAVFCVMMFFPVVNKVSYLNVFWLFTAQSLFYLFLTVYVTPYFALLPELGHTSDEKLNLSTYISITYALGIILASQAPNIGNLFKSLFSITDNALALQLAIATLALFASLCMLFPALKIKESDYCEATPSDIPLFQALAKTFKNVGFRFYVVADFSYFMGLTIVMTGLAYYITVLLGLEDAMMGILLPVMILVSFVFYPFVNILAKKTGKKVLVTLSFLTMSAVFASIFFLGKFPFSSVLQGYMLVICYAVPLSFLSVLPNAILADIAEHDGLKTGIKQEGMFFAARTLMQKFGQTAGVLTFAMLTTFGKDPGNDLGIRISGIVGFALCIFAGIIFIGFNERKILLETDELKKQ